MRTNLPPKPPFDNLNLFAAHWALDLAETRHAEAIDELTPISSTRKGELLRFEIGQKIARREALMRSMEEIQLKKERKNHRTKG